MYHQHTGYVPVTLAGYELSKQQGYYEKNPGADIAIKSLTRGTVTENSQGVAPRPPAGDPQHHLRGSREGPAGAADRAAGAGHGRLQRGNRVLRDFEKSAKG